MSYWTFTTKADTAQTPLPSEQSTYQQPEVPCRHILAGASILVLNLNIPVGSLEFDLGRRSSDNYLRQNEQNYTIVTYCFIVRTISEGSS